MHIKCSLPPAEDMRDASPPEINGFYDMACCCLAQYKNLDESEFFKILTYLLNKLDTINIRAAALIEYREIIKHVYFTFPEYDRDPFYFLIFRLGIICLGREYFEAATTDSKKFSDLMRYSTSSKWTSTIWEDLGTFNNENFIAAYRDYQDQCTYDEIKAVARKLYPEWSDEAEKRYPENPHPTVLRMKTFPEQSNLSVEKKKWGFNIINRLFGIDNSGKDGH